MADKNFAITPSVGVPRSKFDRIHTHKTAVKLGDIVPLYVDDVLPGDTRNIDFGSLIRMSTPIAPIMDDIYFELFAFYVPKRLTWEHWKEFMGENNTSAGIYNGEEYLIPTASVNMQDLGENPYCIGQYMGILGCNNEDALAAGGSGTNNLEISELYLRAYHLICNRWFRNQNVEGPTIVGLGDDVSNTLSYTANCRVASKKADYFTKALPYAQKGQPVMLPLGNTAPIVATSGSGPIVSLNLDLNTAVSGSSSYGLQWNSSTSTGSNPTVFGSVGLDGASSSLQSSLDTRKIAVDLTQATAATINNLYEAFALQKLLYADSEYGSRYWEILYGHFGITAPDASLQDPEFLGHAKININVDQVLQTTGYANDTSSALGAIGANSVSGDRGSLFTKSFVEHGVIMILGVARHRESYGQGINRMFTRKRRFDFYWPEFANLPAQAVLNKEIYATGGASDDEIFGYQEAWSEYRYKPNMATSIMNPANANSLSFWTLTSKFDSLPTLSTSFTKANRNSLGRALTTGENGPDFICDFVFKDVAVRPMPAYSKPGLTGVL